MNINQNIGLFVSAGHGFGATLQTAVGAGVPIVQIHAPTNLGPWYINVDGRPKRNLFALRRNLERAGIATSALCGGSRRDRWDTIAKVHETVGLTAGTRAQKRALVQYYCALVGIARNVFDCHTITGHLGSPHLLSEADRGKFKEDLRMILEACERLSVTFNVETGPEPVPVLLELLEEMNTRFFRVNFDPANLILYGNETDPVAAFEKLRRHIGSVHIKDAKRTTGTPGVDWGTEVEPGEGEAQVRDIALRTYLDLYEVPMFVEREIQGESPEQKGAGMIRTAIKVRRWLYESKARKF